MALVLVLAWTQPNHDRTAEVAAAKSFEGAIGPELPVLAQDLARRAGLLHPEVGYTRAGRQEIHWQVDDQPGAQTIVLDEQSVILAVGGLRGITAEICRQLATTHPARFVLVGREAPDGVAARWILPAQFRRGAQPVHRATPSRGQTHRAGRAGSADLGQEDRGEKRILPLPDCPCGIPPLRRDNLQSSGEGLSAD